MNSDGAGGSADRMPGLRRWTLYGLFFVSGAAGLVYQISWVRQIGLFFGHTARAAVIVVAAFFAGLACGNALGGRLAPSLERPLAGYAAAEAAAAAWALVVPSVLAAIEGGDPGGLLYHSNLWLRSAMRGGACLAILFPACLALGATLPFVAEYVARRSDRDRREATTAYAVNTAGAVAGGLAATFWLMPRLGVTGSTEFAAVAALLGAGVAVGMAYAGSSGRGPAESSPPPGAERPAFGAQWWVLATFTGAATIGAEVLYTRLFGLVFNNSVYSYGVVAAVFIASLAAGSELVAQLGGRVEPSRGAAWSSLIGAVALPGSVVVFVGVTDLGQLQVDGAFPVFVAAAVGLVAATVGPAVTVLAGLLPWAWQGAGRGTTAEIVGGLTAANSAAAAAGALGVEFGLLPTAGLFDSFGLLACGYLGVALWFFGRSGGAVRHVATAGVLGAAAIAGVFALERPRSHGSQYRTWKSWDSPYGYIEIRRQQYTGELELRQNLHYTLGGSIAREAELRQGHLPLLLHGAPERTLFMGLGTGITASAALGDSRVESITVTELVPAVVEAAGYFDDYNGDLLDRPEVEVVVDDARHYLRRTDRRFDVVVSDVFVPWHSQTGYLYTVEHYRRVEERLAAGGIFAQWLPVYQLSADELELVADSMASVFAHVSVWQGRLGEESPLVALVGTRRPLAVGRRELRQRLESIDEPFRPDPDGPYGSADRVLERSLGAWRRRRGLLNTDEHPRIEFRAPVSEHRGDQLVGRRWREYRDRVLETLPELPAD